MNTKKIVPFGLAVAMITGGCATSGDVENLQRQIRIVHQQMENIKSTTMEQLQKRQAAASSHLDQLEQDIVQLRAQIEESYYLNQRLREQNKELEAAISNVAEQEEEKRQQALQTLIAEQREKEERIQQMLKKQQENVKAIQAARVRELELKAKEAKIAAQLARQRKSTVKSTSTLAQDDEAKAIYATQKKVVRKQRQTLQQDEVAARETSTKKSPATPVKPTFKTPEVPSSPVVSKTENKDTGDSRMKKANRLLQQKKYQQALDLFENIADENDSANQSTARFMAGECQFAMKQYDLAVVNYQSVFTKAPGSAVAPQALIRQAQAFEKMADSETAKLIYAKIIKNYGSSPQAAKAKERLQRL